MFQHFVEFLDPPAGFFETDMGKYHEEFITTPAEEQIFRTYHAANRLSNGTNGCITGRMTILVIQRFKVVEVHDSNGATQRLLFTFTFTVNHGVEGMTVENSSERITFSKEFQFG